MKNSQLKFKSYLQKKIFNSFEAKLFWNFNNERKGTVKESGK
jgi:hypothetical protein